MGLTLPTTCGICGQRFTIPSVSDLVQTDEGKARMGTILETLVQHIKDEHKQSYQEGGLRSAQFLRLHCLMQFQTEDKEAAQLRDFMRYQLSQLLQKHAPGTDEELGKIVDGLQLTARDKPKVLALLKGCRDIWCEMGSYQPQPLAPGPANGRPTLVRP